MAESSSDGGEGMGCLLLIVLAALLSVAGWILSHSAEFAAGVVYSPLFAAVVVADPAHAVGMLGQLTLDAYFRSALAYWPISLVLITLILVALTWPRVLIGVVSLAAFGLCGAIVWALAATLNSWAGRLTGWPSIAVWLLAIVLGIAGVYFCVRLLHRISSRLLGPVENFAELHDKLAPLLSRPWWIIALALPWAAVFRSSLATPQTPGTPALSFFISVVVILGSVVIWLRVFDYSFFTPATAIRTQVDFFIRWIPLLRESDDIGWRLATMGAIGGGYVALSLLPMPDWSSLPQASASGRFSEIWGEWLIVGCLLLGAVFAVIRPRLFLRLALRVTAVAAAFLVWKAWAYLLSASLPANPWISLVPALLLTAAGFVAIREIGLMEVALDGVLFPGSRFAPMLALVSLPVYALGAKLLVIGAEKNLENPFWACAGFVVCLVTGMFAMGVRPAYPGITGQPLLSPLVGVFGALWATLLAPLRRYQEVKRLQAQMEEARLKFESLVQSGELREMCSEELLLTCKHCGSASEQSAWTKKQGTCGDCGEGSPSPQGECTRCKRSCTAAGAQHECHSISIYRETGKITFDATGQQSAPPRQPENTGSG